MVIASFNDYAYKIIKEWGLHSHFLCERSGCIQKKRKYNSYNLYYNNVDLCKVKQINNMWNNELFYLQDTIKSVTFYDDDYDNINKVKQMNNIPNINAVLIDSKLGFDYDNFDIDIDILL